MNVILKTMIFGTLSVVSFSVYADSSKENQEITWPIPWENPIQLVYEMSSHEVTVKKEVKTETKVTSTETINGAPDGNGKFIQKWSDANTKVELIGYPEDQSQLINGIYKSFEGVVLEVVLDKDGAYETIKNIDEITVLFSNAMKTVIDNAEAEAVAKLPKEKVAEFKLKYKESTASMLAVLTSKDFILSKVAIVPQAYNYFTGGGLDATQAYEYEDEVENPIGGDPYPVKAHIEISIYEEDPGFVHGLWITTLDAEKGKPILQDSVAKLFGNGLSKADVEKYLTEMEVSRRTEYRIELATGIVYEYKSVETKNFPGNSEQTTLNMVLQP